jgi:hypothetical protein
VLRFLNSGLITSYSLQLDSFLGFADTFHYSRHQLLVSIGIVGLEVELRDRHRATGGSAESLLIGG